MKNENGGKVNTPAAWAEKNRSLFYHYKLPQKYFHLKAALSAENFLTVSGRAFQTRIRMYNMLIGVPLKMTSSIFRFASTKQSGFLFPLS
jgi:hypothetical protein